MPVTTEEIAAEIATRSLGWTPAKGELVWARLHADGLWHPRVFYDSRNGVIRVRDPADAKSSNPLRREQLYACVSSDIAPRDLYASLALTSDR